MCRAREESDCIGGTPVFEDGECRARQTTDCTGDTPVFEGGECRARTQSDCIGKTNKYEFQGTIILDGQTCREPTNDADCASAGGFVFKQGTVQNKCVRPRRKEDCPSSRPVYQREEGGLPLYYCRAATNARECLANTPIFEGGECRAPITSQECKTHFRMSRYSTTGRAALQTNRANARETNPTLNPVSANRTRTTAFG